jgi:signal transduction histidine kinase
MPLSSLSPSRALPARDVLYRGLRSLRTAGLCFLALVDVAFAAQGFDARAHHAAGLTWSSATSLSGFATLISLAGSALAIAVIWRDRYPVHLALAGVAGAVAFQLGPTVALIGLMSVAKLRPRERAAQVGALVAVTAIVRVWFDVRSDLATEPFWPSLFSGINAGTAWWLSPIIGLALVACFLGLGLWFRTRTELAAVTQQVEDGRAQVGVLTDQVSRQAERERLAREIHDGLGHNLSILSIHANALQAMTDSAATSVPHGPVDPRTSAQIKESAQVVQETAARSVTELHGLLGLLRNPGDPDITAPTKTLRDVRNLIDESVAAGMPLIATVFLDDSTEADPHIAQATFRVVQELLTNARKHAPDIPVRLELRGGPRDGTITITTANHLPRQSSPAQPGTEPARAGTGLSGIRERVEHHGGTMAAGVDPHGAFRVSIRLPWAPPDPTTDRPRTS